MSDTPEAIAWKLYRPDGSLANSTQDMEIQLRWKGYIRRGWLGQGYRIEPVFKPAEGEG